MRRRGGHCFALEVLFCALLRALDFDVSQVRSLPVLCPCAKQSWRAGARPKQYRWPFGGRRNCMGRSLACGPSRQYRQSALHGRRRLRRRHLDIASPARTWSPRLIAITDRALRAAERGHAGLRSCRLSTGCQRCVCVLRLRGIRIANLYQAGHCIASSTARPCQSFTFTLQRYLRPRTFDFSISESYLAIIWCSC